MQGAPRIAFVGAGSTVFMKNLIGDILQREALSRSHISLMDIDPARLEDARIVATKLVATIGAEATVSVHLDQREALRDADFVIVAFQIGGYDPCTINDFEIPKQFGLRQTIADTLGIGGIMRGLRTVPHLWKLCADMQDICPDALLLQYVNPMAINMSAIRERYPQVRAVGLCHSVQGTAMQLANDLEIPMDRIRYRCAGINHMAFYLEFGEVQPGGEVRDLYPELKRGYAEGRIPKPPRRNVRCPNRVRYEVMRRLGYFVTESSEHFAEYVPWFIKRGRDDLIRQFGIPLDEYKARCIEQIAKWQEQARVYRESDRIEIDSSGEYASDIINSAVTGTPSIIYGNVANTGLIATLPNNATVEVACLVDGNGIQPTHAGALPPQLTALIRTNLNVQELTVAALTEESREHIYHAAMMDPHTAAELDLDQICLLVDKLLEAHADWLPPWTGRA
ncbi:MAG: alpha-glucosidase/alpha-galactosidase [Rhodobacteraceae bacterium]|nr:alpha-glucosidase/alpha-galactosidase [Paracoccaceae bacterium]